MGEQAVLVVNDDVLRGDLAQRVECVDSVGIYTAPTLHAGDDSEQGIILIKDQPTPFNNLDDTLTR
jgi:hypothetical protein